jgi:peptide/nickel transport system permease protein
MIQYAAHRLLYAMFVLVGVATIVFLLVRLTGDPVKLMLPPDATQGQEQALRHSLGLDAPQIVQYAQFMASVGRLDLGQSLRYGQPALSLILQRYPATLQLAAAALLFSLVIAIPAGVLAATRRGKTADTGVMSVALIGQSSPAFFTGIFLILLFAVTLRWLPTGGIGTPQHLVLPAVTLGLYLMSAVARLTRSAMLDVLNEDYLRTARAKGLSSTAVMLRHALRNSMLPVITMIGLETGALLGGSIITETVFAWPGVGQLVVQAIAARDYPLVQASVLVLAATFVLINLTVDLSYSWLDPRIRYQ